MDEKIIQSRETDKILHLVASPSFARHHLFGNNLAGIHMHKSKLLLNKPVYTGMAILENSKILMYDFFYNHLKAKYRLKCELICTDTDSLLLDIQTEDVYKDMMEDIYLYDTNNFPKDNILYSEINKMKDDCEGQMIKEAVAIRPKMYLVLEGNKKYIRKAKGVKKNVVEKEVRLDYYRETLFEKKQFWQGMNVLQGHKIYTACM